LEEFWSQDHEPYRQLLNEFHTRPAEAQLVTIEDWALQKESSEAEVVMSAGVMDMSTVAQVRGRRIRTYERDMHKKSRNSGLRFKTADDDAWRFGVARAFYRHKPFPTVSQVEGIFVELWELQAMGRHALSSLQKVRKNGASLLIPLTNVNGEHVVYMQTQRANEYLVIDLKRNIFMT